MNKYSVIYADPPWDIKTGGDGHWGLKNGKSRLPYPSMTIDEIKKLNIKQLINKDCKLFLWTVNKYLKESLDIMKEWGFKYSTTIVWCKKPNGIGFGGTFSLTTEYLLFGVKGKVESSKRHDTTWWLEKRGKHSVKPNKFRRIIEESFPSDNKLELFARQKTEGWDVWGNEVESDIELNSSPKN